MANEPVETKNEIVEEAINKLMSDDEKIKEILTANSSEEMKEVFKSVGLELTDEQIEVFKKTFIDGMNAEINKLPVEEREKFIKEASEAELEKISGGEAWGSTKVGLGWGTAAGLGLGALMGLTVAVESAIDIFDRDGSLSKCWNNKLKPMWKYCLKGAVISTVTGAVIGTTVGLSTDLCCCNTGNPFAAKAIPKATPKTAKLIDI